MNVNTLLIDGQPEDLWNATLERLMAKLPQSTFHAWFSNLEIIEYKNSTLHIGTPNSFVQDFVAQHYKTLISETISEILNEPTSIQFSSLDKICQGQYPAEEISDLAVSSPSASQTSPTFEIGTRIDTKVPLCARYTFDKFVVGDCNQLAHAACLAVAESPQQNNFNPLVIYGGTGMGKTHLLHAVAHYVKDAETAQRVVCRTSEEFTHEYIHHIHREKNSRGFYRVYRDIDVLLIDDIQFLAGKNSTQEEFYSIFNNLLQLNKQIVITSDRLPYEIKGLHSRLLSRFETGLLVNLQPPKLETRLAILKKKIEQGMGSSLPEDVLSFVASGVTSNVRELEGTLTKLSAYACFKNLPITLEIAQEILGDTLRNVNKPVNLKTIISLVAEAFNISPSHLTSQTRKKAVSIPRHIAMYIARELTDNSLHTIGLAFGRDYSTVIHSLKKAEGMLETDPDMNQKIQELMSLAKHLAKAEA